MLHKFASHPCAGAMLTSAFSFSVGAAKVSAGRIHTLVHIRQQEPKYIQACAHTWVLYYPEPILSHFS